MSKEVIVSKFFYEKKKNFIGMSTEKGPIIFEINNCFIPFGIEKFNGKDILNIELEKGDNQLYNIYSKLSAIESNIKKGDYTDNLSVTQATKGKGFMPSVKKSALGHIIRTHIRNPDIYVLQKDGEKFPIDPSNLKKAYVDAKVMLNGIWINDNNFGLLFATIDIRVKKFGD